MTLLQGLGSRSLRVFPCRLTDLRKAGQVGMQESDGRGGLVAVLREHRGALRRYLLAHGAGDLVDDLLQELEIKVRQGAAGPVQVPLGYLYRAATNLMIDHRRSLQQAQARERAWAELADRTEASSDPAPSAEREIDAREQLEVVRTRLHELPERARRILLRHRVDGLSQRAIAAEFHVSQSTVESDLRLAYRWLDDLRRQLDKEIGA